MVCERWCATKMVCDKEEEEEAEEEEEEEEAGGTDPKDVGKKPISME